MTRKSIYLRYCLLQGLLLSALPVATMAQPLEEVSLAYQRQGIVATIHLSGRIQYLRHFPQNRGKTLVIFYQRVPDASSNEPWLDNDVRKSPPSSLIPGFTVTTRDQSTQPKLVIQFAREAEFSVSAGKDNRSLLIIIRPEKVSTKKVPLPFLPTVKPEVKAPAGATLKPQEALAVRIRQQAHDLMVQAHDALAARNNDAAVEALNKLLLLPPNDYTQDAQEWIGVARERAGEPDKAKVEYDLYLKLYPGSAGAARVAQRLNGLSGLGAEGKPAAFGEGKVRPPTVTTFGSIASHYYYGRSKISTSSTFNGVTTTDSISMTDQSMLITSVDASERYADENRDSRLVFRDIATANFIAGQHSQNLLTAAYGEVKGRTSNYLLRLGRQSATGGGVLGRFDGLAASYGDPQQLRVNAVGGLLVDYLQGPKPRFAGMSVDMGALSLYGITQTVEGIQDRRAVGAEYRYADEGKSAYGLLDYDTWFKAVNAVQLTGTTNNVAMLPDKSMVSFMLDHRKTPSLSIRNALIGATTSSVSDLLQTMTLSSLRDLALARTAISNTGQVSVTVPVRNNWQVGGDFRVTNTTGLGTSGQTLNPAIDPITGLPIECTGTPTIQGCIPAQPGRGLERSATGRVTGSGLYTQGDIWSAGLTLSTSSSVNGRSLFLYNHTQTGFGLMIDTTLQTSYYKDQFDGKMTQIMPMVRGSYRFRESFTFDADGGYQRVDYSGPQTSSKTSRYFCSLGLRWDF